MNPLFQRAVLFGIPGWPTFPSNRSIQQAARRFPPYLISRPIGDIFIYLPTEKVIATGDALIDGMPSLNDGYPEEWVQTLTALQKEMSCDNL
jgi:hypothetical protein